MPPRRPSPALLCLATSLLLAAASMRIVRAERDPAHEHVLRRAASEFEAQRPERMLTVQSFDPHALRELARGTLDEREGCERHDVLRCW